MYKHIKGVKQDDMWTIKVNQKLLNTERQRL